MSQSTVMSIDCDTELRIFVSDGVGIFVPSIVTGATLQSNSL